jgi:hypothetical protein
VVKTLTSNPKPNQRQPPSERSSQKQLRLGGANSKDQKVGNFHGLSSGNAARQNSATDQPQLGEDLYGESTLILIMDKYRQAIAW